MGTTASREDGAKRLLQHGVLTLPLGSQVEKLFHEDFDDDAQALLTPSTPTTPALLLNDKKQDRKSWTKSLEVNKWAPVLSGTSNKRDSGHGSATGTSTEHLSPQVARSIASSRQTSGSSVEPEARQVRGLQAEGSNDGHTTDPGEPTTRDFAASPRIVYGPKWTAADSSANHVLPSPINSQSSIRLPEHISPLTAVSRIARRMAANASAANNSNVSTPPDHMAPTSGDNTTNTTTVPKDDSQLLSEEISTHDSQPNPSAHLLGRLTSSGGAQQVFNETTQRRSRSQSRSQSRSRSRSRSQSRERERVPSIDKLRKEGLRRSGPTSAARLDDLVEMVSPGKWQRQQRLPKRMSDEDFGERERRLSEVSLNQRVSWLEDPSAPSSDMEED